MRKETSAGAIVFFQQGKRREYLLLNYLGGHWDFPKGHIELHEKPKTTVIRETKEETGLDIIILPGFKEKITYTFKHQNEVVIKEVIFYLAKAKNQKVKLSEEHKGYVWLPFKEALKLATFNKNLLKKAENFLNKRNKQGFTLIEILIVIGMILAIIAIIGQIFKPSAYLQKSRDIKRIGDLKALETALKTYLTFFRFATSTVILPKGYLSDFESVNKNYIGLTPVFAWVRLDYELDNGFPPPNTGVDEASSTIFISVPWDKENVRNYTIVWRGKTYYFSQVSSTDYFRNDGYGWLPIKFTILPYPPLSSLPVDPVNSFNKKFFYSFVFKRSSSTFEINANLEFESYKFGGSNDQVSGDGGDSDKIYEVGNDLTLMPNNLYP
jgi:prepilin-type N-terminal cleavage/methylation domain-containing protein